MHNGQNRGKQKTKINQEILNENMGKFFTFAEVGRNYINFAEIGENASLT